MRGACSSGDDACLTNRISRARFSPHHELDSRATTRADAGASCGRPLGRLRFMSVVVSDTRMQTLAGRRPSPSNSAQELMTKDKVTLRLSLTVELAVEDPQLSRPTRSRTSGMRSTGPFSWRAVTMSRASRWTSCARRGQGRRPARRDEDAAQQGHRGREGSCLQRDPSKGGRRPRPARSPTRRSSWPRSRCSCG